MRLLAFETATQRLSVALWQDGATIERSALLLNGDQRKCKAGSEMLLPWMHELLAEAGVSLQQIDGIAFGAGPGNFTGLRLACGVAQGLAFGLDVPAAPICTLAALALDCGQRHVWTCLDARMNEVYAAAYVVDGEAVSEMMAPVCLPPAVLPAPTFLDVWGAGDGFARYGEILRSCKPDLAGVRADMSPSAVSVARLAAPVLASGGGVAAAAAQPLYVRNKVAFTTAERLARGGSK